MIGKLCVWFYNQSLTKYIKLIPKPCFVATLDCLQVHKDHLNKRMIRRFLTRYYLVALIAPIVFQLHSHLAQKLQLFKISFALSVDSSSLLEMCFGMSKIKLKARRF